MEAPVKTKKSVWGTKRRAVITLEAALLIPTLLFLFLLLFDGLYLAYMKTGAKSGIELSLIEAKSNLSQLTNKEFNQMKTASPNIDRFLSDKLRRTMMDELNLQVDEASFYRYAEQRIASFLPGDSESKSILLARKDSLFRSSYKLDYDLFFSSFLNKAYQGLQVKMDRMIGTSSLKEHRIFDEIVSIDTGYYFATHSKQVSKLLEQVEKALRFMKSNG